MNVDVAYARIKKITPVQWVIIALAVLGGAGLLYWLLKPIKPKAVSQLAPVSNADYQQATFGKTFTVTGDEFTSPVDGTDQGGGSYSSNPAWVVGNYGAIEGTDFEGRPFVTSAAPTIPFEAKPQPYRHGIDYSFAEQTAKSIANHKRFPEFGLSDAKIHSMGPWYSRADANEIFTRGITTITCLPSFRNGPTDVRELPQNQKNWMCPDDILWDFSGQLADILQGENPNDPRIPALRRCHDEHYLEADSSAFRELGKYCWTVLAPVQDANNQGMRYFSLDIESSVPASYPNWEVVMGSFYEGFCGAAAAEGVTVRPFTYGGPEQVNIEPISNRQGGGLPEYLGDQYDFFANLSEKEAAVCEFGGVFAVDTYQQGIFGEEDMLVRDGSGMPQIGGNNQPVYNNLGSTVVYGQTIPLENNEAEKCLRDLYQQSTRLYLQNHRLAGQYPAVKGMRREGFQTAQMGAFTRYTNEGVEGVQLNDRPLPSWLADMFNGLNLFLSPHLWCWGVDFNNEPDQPGTNHSNVWQYQAHGVAEFIMKAAHRHSAFRNIQNSNFKWCWFNLAIVDNFQTDGNGYHQKAIAHAKIRDVNSQVFVEFWYAFPATDSRSTVVTITAQQNGTQASYEMELPNGRRYLYDCWYLPSNFNYNSLEGADISIAYLDTMNVLRTQKGDYRQN